TGGTPAPTSRKEAAPMARRRNIVRAAIDLTDAHGAVLRVQYADAWFMLSVFDETGQEVCQWQAIAAEGFSGPGERAVRALKAAASTWLETTTAIRAEDSHRARQQLHQPPPAPNNV